VDIRYLGGLYAGTRRLGGLESRAPAHRGRALHALWPCSCCWPTRLLRYFSIRSTPTPAAIAFYAAVMILFRSKGDLGHSDCVVFVAALIALGPACPAHFGLPMLFGVLLSGASTPPNNSSLGTRH
jgi:hypothetical protein